MFEKDRYWAVIDQVQAVNRASHILLTLLIYAQLPESFQLP